MGDDFRALAERLEVRLQAGIDAEWPDSEFEEWAFTAFRHQFGACSTYRAFCELRGKTPETVEALEDVPSVPATAFKHFDLISAHGVAPEAVFWTSGTTGIEIRGRHSIPRVRLYRASLREPFRMALLPDVEKVTFVSLVPPPQEAQRSSLSYMVGAAAEYFASDTHWLVDGEGAWRPDSASILASLEDTDEPVLLLGTALAFAHLVEWPGALPVKLPPGSRIMETGGFKGARRVIPRADLYRRITEMTGVPKERIVNEYGMTELLSQLYEPVLTEGSAAMGLHRPPPWLRVRALDPTTLTTLPEGELGILAFFDLANLGSVSHVLTEDVGSIEGGRVRLAGRAAGAEPRGCSRAMDDLMASARR